MIFVCTSSSKLETKSTYLQPLQNAAILSILKMIHFYHALTTDYLRNQCDNYITKERCDKMHFISSFLPMGYKQVNSLCQKLLVKVFVVMTDAVHRLPIS